MSERKMLFVFIPNQQLLPKGDGHLRTCVYCMVLYLEKGKRRQYRSSYDFGED